MIEVRNKYKTKKLTVILLMYQYGGGIKRTSSITGISYRRIKKIYKDVEACNA